MSQVSVQVKPPRTVGKCPKCGSYPKQRKRGYCDWCDVNGAYRQ